MRSQALRHTAASVGVALCLALVHAPAAVAKPAHAVPARSRQVKVQPASHGVLTTVWNFLVVVVTGNPPTGPGTSDPNVVTPVDLGGAMDPNGSL